MYPECFTSADRDHVDGVVYAPDEPMPERIAFQSGEVIYFDYVVIPISAYEYEVDVDVTGPGFSHTRTFDDVESAQDWVYSFMEDAGLDYEQTRGMIRNGR